MRLHSVIKNQPIYFLMRMTWKALPLLLFLLCVQVVVRAQQVTLQCNNLPLEQVLENIKKQTGYSIIYHEAAIQRAKPVTMKVQNESLTTVLERCLKPQGLIAVIKNNSIVITREKENKISNPDCDTCGTMSTNYSGQLTNSKGMPLEGVLVAVKGGQQTMTNSSGTFHIAASSGQSVMFYLMGYKRIVKTLGKDLSVKLMLEEDVKGLKEVTVYNTGYQQIKAEQLTGSVSRISSKEFESRITSGSILDGLQNKLPGLMINPSMQFEGNPLFQIRGISTISGNKQPLIVLDGFPTELTLDAIDPNEIQSVTILKDAAAAAIYGVRASNGVIIVERKKAKEGKTIFNFRTTTSVTPKENYTTYRFAPPVAQLRYMKDTYSDYPAQTWNDIKASPYPYQPGSEIFIDLASGIIQKDQIDKRITDLTAYDNTKDYSRLFKRATINNQYDLVFSGGTKNGLYYVSSNFTNNSGPDIKQRNQRFLLSARGTYKFSERLSLDMSNDYFQLNNSVVPVPDINEIYPWERFQDNSGNPLPIFSRSNINPVYNKEFLLANGFNDNLFYPLNEINHVSNKMMSTGNKIRAEFKYNIIKGLSFKLGGIYEKSNTKQTYFADDKSAAARQMVNYYVTQDPATSKFVFNMPKGGYQTQQFNSQMAYTLRGQFDYTTTIHDDHSLNFILGAEGRNVESSGTTTSAFGYNAQTLVQMPVDFNLLFNQIQYSAFTYGYYPGLYSSYFNQTYSDDRFLSGYFNGVYSYKSRYSLSGSIRIDQSNLFGTDPKYRYKPLWSVGAAWNISNESFFPKTDWIDMLKLRVSKGFNGNVSKNSLPVIIASATTNNRTQPISPSLDLLNLQNSALRWEQTDNGNLGVDFSAFNRIRFNFDYYMKKSRDILAASAIDPTRGASSATINAASIDNKGWEVNINADWIRKKKLNWNTGFVLAHNTSKVIAVYTNPGRYAYTYFNGDKANNYVKGYPVGAMFSYRFAGLNDAGLPTVYDSKGNVKKYAYASNDEGLNDLSYSGNSIPVMNAGFSNRVDIGRFYVYCMVDFYGGFKTRIPRPLMGNARPLAGAENYFRNAGDQLHTDVMGFYDYTKLDSYHDFQVYNNSDKYAVNGAYMLLRDLTVSYSLPTETLKQLKLSSLEIKLQGTNLFTKGFNDYNYSLALGSFVRTRLVPTYTIGLFANF